MIFDYASHYLKLQQLMKQMHKAQLKHDVVEVKALANEMVVEARAIRAWCLDQLEKHGKTSDAGL